MFIRASMERFAVLFVVVIVVALQQRTLAFQSSISSRTSSRRRTFIALNQQQSHPALAYRLHRLDLEHAVFISAKKKRQVSLHTQIYSSPTSSSSDAAESSGSEDTTSNRSNDSGAAEGVSDVASWRTKVRNYFRGPQDGLTTKQRLAKMGLAAALSYGWVSNMSYSVSVSVAWYIFSKQTGLSPLAPGQWKKFLAVYAGFWMFNNIVRPIRVGMAVAISPKFDNFVTSLQDRMRVSRATAVTITVVLANLIGTTLFMSSGIAIAAIAAGVPVFPP
jgi:hypothetical protein